MSKGFGIPLKRVLDNPRVPKRKRRFIALLIEDNTEGLVNYFAEHSYTFGGAKLYSPEICYANLGVFIHEELEELRPYGINPYSLKMDVTLPSPAPWQEGYVHPLGL